MAMGKLVGLFSGYFLVLVGLKYFLIATFAGVYSGLLRLWAIMAQEFPSVSFDF